MQVRGNNELSTSSVDSSLWAQKLAGISDYKSISESPKDSYEKIAMYSTYKSYELREAAEKNLDDAKLIVQTPSLVNKLNANNLISIMIEQKETVKIILNNSILTSKLEDSHLLKLGDENLEAAFIIINTSFLCNKCSDQTLRELGVKHTEVGKKILTTPEIFGKCDSYSIYSIGRRSVENVTLIMQNGLLSNQLNGYELSEFARKSPQCAIDILNNQALQAKLNGSDLGNLCTSSPEAAIFTLKNSALVKRCDSRQLDEIASVSHEATMYVLQNPYFHEKSCNPSFLEHVAVANKDAAMQILQTPLLVKRLDRYELINIVCAHSEAAIYILQNPAMNSQLNDYELGQIGSKHVEAGNMILRTPNLLAKCGQSAINKLGEKYVELAQIILSTKAIREKCSNKILYFIGLSHVETTLSVLKEFRYFSGNIVTSYSGEERILESLALKNQEIAMTILNNSNLRLICHYSIKKIGLAHFETAMFILKNSPNVFDNDDLRLVGLDHEECAKMILSTPALKSKCDPRTIEILKSAHVKENNSEEKMTSSERLMIVPQGEVVPVIHVKENEQVTVMVGYETRDEAAREKESIDKLMNTFNKMKLLERYPASTKLLVLVGESTRFETCTPDENGNPHDGYGNNVSKGIFIGTFFARSAEQREKDIKAAIDDPKYKLKVVSAKRQ